MGSTYFSKRLYKNKRYLTSKNRAVRPKTFKSEQAANDYATKNGITSFTLENLKTPENSVMKIRINVK